MEAAELVVRLYNVGAVKFGHYKLKSGIESPVYIDLRVLVSHPQLLTAVSELLWRAAPRNGFQCVCGVPYTALPLATVMSVEHSVPMLMRRKETKDYGTKRAVEGVVGAGTVCLVVEDVVTSGGSVLETAQVLRDAGVGVANAVVLLDREQGGRENLQREGITLHSVLTLSQVLGHLQDKGKISMKVVTQVQEFLQQHSSVVSLSNSPMEMSFSDRSSLAPHPLGKKLLTIMETKRTNLALSADVESADALLKLAESTAPHICMLKTHADILYGFSSDVARQLRALADTYGFLIMEDRKFADIGNTCRLQYSCHGYHMNEKWAELVTCHALPGPGVLEGIGAASHEGSGCVIVAEMSSQGTLATADYTKAAVAMAEDHSDSVVGVVCRGRVCKKPYMVHMTPGVRLEAGEDNMGQQYLTPEQAILRNGSDVIIVGRGIYQASDPVRAAKLFQERAFSAYQKRLVTPN